MKKLNKIISLTIAAMMAIPMFVTANAAEETVLVNEHFEDDIAASVWTGDYAITDGVNQSMTSVADKTQFYCRLGNSTIESGAMIISYDVMLPELSGIRIKQVWDAASGGKRPYLIESTSAGKLTMNGTEFGTYTPGKWFNLTEVVDIDQKKTAVYLDGSYINEYAWRADGATGINNIQTQYNGNSISVDNVYVAAYGDKTEADAALEQMLSQKLSLEKSDFTVGANQTVRNAITPITSGAEIISYDITTTGKARLMQIYDNQESAKRAVLIQIGAKGTIVVNEKDTGVLWEHNQPNTLTLIYDAAEKTSTVYYNGTQAGSANYAVYKDNGLNLADIRTQDEENGGLTVSNAWAKRFASYDEAVKYYNTILNADNSQAIEHYNLDAGTISTVVSEYARALDALTYTEGQKSAIIDEMSGMMPYTNIFAEDFDTVTELTGYTAASGAAVDQKRLKLTNSGSKARLLKTVKGSTSLISECDFMQETKSDIDSIMRITDGTGNSEAVKILTDHGDIVMYYGPQNSDNSFQTKVLISNYNTNQWYNLKVYANLDTKKVSVYLDNVCAGTYDFMYTEMTDLSRVFDSYTNTAGEYYLDNIHVYRDSIFEAAQDISVPSKVTADISLPDAAGDYACSWISDNTDVIANDGTVNRPSAASAEVTLTAALSNGLANVTTSFKTRAAATDKDFEIGRIIYADSNEFSTETKKGAIGIKRIYVNKNNDSVSAKMIVAMYNAKNEFVQAKITDANDGMCAIGAAIDETATKIKVFVWDENLKSFVTPVTAE